MYKKIAAGVIALALTLGTAALPAETFANISTGAAITASAAEVSGDFEYNILDDGTVEIAKYTGSETSLTVPAQIDGKKVTSIGNKAFYVTSPETISLPEGITTIKDLAFNNSKLKEIKLPSTVTEIGQLSFAFSYNLEKVELPSGLTEIPDGAFKACYALTQINIPSKVTRIGNAAFELCRDMTSITIPDSVNYIDSQAFNLCYDLENINIPSTVQYVGSRAISRTAYEEKLPDGMVYLGKTAYEYKGNIAENTSVSIKEGTEVIGDLFSSLEKNVVSVTLPSSVKIIDSGAFSNTSITQINIPDGVESIEAYAFSGTLLESINLPDGVISIGNQAFGNCKQLKSIDIPDSTKTLGDFLFAGCESLESVKLSKNASEIKRRTFKDCKSLTSVTIPEGVETIGEYAFLNCTSLSEIKLPSTISSIERNAFEASGIENLNIPDGIEVISKNICYNCSNLKSVTMTDSVKTIEYSAFYNCPLLSEVKLSSNITSIDYNAFNRCNSLKSITVPESVETFGKKCIGYSYDSTTKKEVVSEDFTIVGKSGSAAEEYAAANGIKFVTETPVITDITKCEITLSGTEFSYTGNAIKPKVTVKAGDKVLTLGTDYAVRYINNTEIGTATVRIAGKGDYTGTVEKTFTIVGETVITEIPKCDITLSGTEFSYTGNAVKPKVTVKAGNKVLTLGTDYAVRYVNNVNVGTASIVIAGRGDYTGSVTKTFTITDSITKELSKCTISLSKTVFKSTGSAIKPKVTVKDGSQTLTLGTDYLVRYVNNVEPGTASVVIAGRGNYTGSVTKTFTILDSNAKDIAECEVTLNKTSFTYTGNGIKPKVTVKDGDTVLTSSVDYNIRYVNNVNVGTATVVVSGTGKYQGSVNMNFDITE